jgi:hypothetical protein
MKETDGKMKEGKQIEQEKEWGRPNTVFCRTYQVWRRWCVRVPQLVLLINILVADVLPTRSVYLCVWSVAPGVICVVQRYIHIYFYVWISWAVASGFKRHRLHSDRTAALTVQLCTLQPRLKLAPVCLMHVQPVFRFSLRGARTFMFLPPAPWSGCVHHVVSRQYLSRPSVRPSLKFLPGRWSSLLKILLCD